MSEYNSPIVNAPGYTASGRGDAGTGWMGADLTCQEPLCRLQGWLDTDVIWRRRDGPPPCSACDRPRVRPIAAPNISMGFASYDAGVYGRIDNRADHERLTGMIQKAHPGKKIAFETVTPAQRRAEVADVRHKSQQSQKARGLDGQQMAEMKEARAAGAAEMAGRSDAQVAAGKAVEE